jgi:hypothetical protein
MELASEPKLSGDSDRRASDRDRRASDWRRVGGRSDSELGVGPTSTLARHGDPAAPVRRSAGLRLRPAGSESGCQCGHGPRPGGQARQCGQCQTEAHGGAAGRAARAQAAAETRSGVSDSDSDQVT